jgi:Fur family peroxide stress response transcriptional regulator
VLKKITRPEIEDSFRRAGLRCTPQRYGVMEFLIRQPVHATADEIHRALNRNDPKISRATVYNSLRALIEAGLVREVIMEGVAARFDGKVHRHHHFICDRCGSVEDIEWFDLPRSSQAAALGSRTIREYQVVFNGICQKCGSR